MNRPGCYGCGLKWVRMAKLAKGFASYASLLQTRRSSSGGPNEERSSSRICARHRTASDSHRLLSAGYYVWSKSCVHQQGTSRTVPLSLVNLNKKYHQAAPRRPLMRHQLMGRSARIDLGFISESSPSSVHLRV